MRKKQLVWTSAGFFVLLPAGVDTPLSEPSLCEFSGVQFQLPSLRLPLRLPLFDEDIDVVVTTFLLLLEIFFSKFTVFF
jgi:hypothetical protein